MLKRIISEKIYSSIALIIIFHVIGFIGFANDPLVNFFMKLVPFHLLLMCTILLWNNQSWNKHFYLFAATIFIGSFLVEMIGTNTGLIFGEYIYGETLGFKLWNTPLVIGINWLILVYGMGTFLAYLTIKNKLLSAFIGATALTILDLLIEPIAIKFDYWAWKQITVPVQNYVAWWILSFIFILIFNRLHFNKQNIVAIILLLVQYLFFILLNLL